jgi:putative sigma-54 modulation protein
MEVSNVGLQITGKRVDVTDAMKIYIDKKIGKITERLRDVQDVIVTLRIERYHHIAEITIAADHLTIRGEGNTADMYSSCSKIEKQIRKYRSRIQSRRSARPEKIREAVMTVYDHGAMAREQDTRVVVSVDKIPVKPMTVEEAVMEMDLMSRDFLVFKNAETDEVSVIYHRRDGNIGLIEP